MFTICFFEGAPKQTPDLRIPPRRDRAPGLEIPGSATAEVCFDAPFTQTLCFVVIESKVHIVNTVWWLLLLVLIKVYACYTVKYKPIKNF